MLNGLLKNCIEVFEIDLLDLNILIFLGKLLDLYEFIVFDDFIVV